MADISSLFAPSVMSALTSEVMSELESILRLHSISPQELFYKWESYSLKMGSEDTKLDLDTVRMFKKDVQDSLERATHDKHVGRGSERKSTVGATPRGATTGGDVFGMQVFKTHGPRLMLMAASRLDELTPNTLPRMRTAASSAKRKGDFGSPIPRKVSKPEGNVSTTRKPANATEGLRAIPFTDRQNAGQTVETLNDHLPLAEAPVAPFSEARIRTVANSDIKKFGYKPMAMRLADSSEILDERIDEFMSIIQKHYGLDDSAFGNAAGQSPNEIVAIGRIASDTPEGKLNSASLVLETSRRMGAGMRVPLKIDALASWQFFPGQIVALRGTNASGVYFTVSDVLQTPLLPVPVSSVQSIEAVNERLGVSDEYTGQPLNIMFASGPYTAEDNLDFEPLQMLCSKAAGEMLDALVLTGPFLDIEHPLLATGDFEISEAKGLDSDATVNTAFRLWISTPLQRLCSAVPSITIILIPSVRDAVSKHVSWPQEQLPKKDLGLPKQVKMLPNPCTISLNETVIGISSQDVLYELSREQISGGGAGQDLMTRLPRFLIEQRHFYPLFPPVSRDQLPKGPGPKSTGACLEVGYLKLGEWLNVRPDVLVVPSILTPSVKVVESVMVINPGTLSKRKAAGTYAQISLQPRILQDEEKNLKSIPHRIFERARVDVVRI